MHKGLFSFLLYIYIYRRSLQRLFGHGIFVADGKKWHYQRKVTSRIFNVVNFRDIFTRVFVDQLEITTKQVLDQHAINGTPLNIQDLLFKFTLDSFVQYVTILLIFYYYYDLTSLPSFLFLQYSINTSIIRKITLKIIE